MNKFVSFEMVFDNGERFMGNKVISFDAIGGEEDIEFLEKEIRDELNLGRGDFEPIVEIVTLVNWKAL